MNIRIDILTLQLFVAIVEEQSIAKAAEKKHIAVSAVSRRISDMEEMLKVDLLYRHSKGIEPTSAGFALLDHARTILGNLSQLQTDLVGYRRARADISGCSSINRRSWNPLPTNSASFCRCIHWCGWIWKKRSAQISSRR